jgi:DNA-binding transcriptional ArsR family regulator
MSEYVAKKFSALRKGGALSIRQLAQATGVPKSSVARHRKALEKRSQWPESAFWEQEAGYQWLRVVVFAVIFVFGIKGGVGAERLSEFFHRVRLDRQVGSSPTALRRLQGQLEEAIMAYPTAQENLLRQADRQVEICAGADETFFDQAILVMMDLTSGYIVLEEPAADRRYATWRGRVEQALAPLGITLRYLVSDRAKALVKLAVDGLACPSIPDVFHALRDLAKVVGVSFHLKLARLEEKRVQAQQALSGLQSKGQESRVQQRFIAHLTEQVATLQTDQARAQALLRDASSAVHPFALLDSARQSAAQVEVALVQALASLNALHRRHTARDNTNSTLSD